MKKLSVGRKILIITNLIFAAISFGPCYAIIATPVVKRDIFPEPFIAEEKDYAALFCIVVILIEIILLKSENNKLRILGLILNLKKTILPSMLIPLKHEIYMSFGGFYGYSYEFTTLGYVLIGVGCVITVLYLIEFIISKRKESLE